MNAQGIRNLVLLGERVTAPQGKELGIVDVSASMEELLTQAIKLGEKVAPKSEKRQAFGVLKTSTYSHVVQALTENTLPSSL